VILDLQGTCLTCLCTALVTFEAIALNTRRSYFTPDRRDASKPELVEKLIECPLPC